MNTVFMRLSGCILLASTLFFGCQQAADKASAATADMGKVKTEIQALETAFAAADNARDAKTISEFYAADAITLPSNKPGISGRENILRDMDSSLAKRAKGSTISFDVQEVFGTENMVTEIGKTSYKDSTGKLTGTGKYMAIWEKRNGKYECIRDISNDDAKAPK